MIEYFCRVEQNKRPKNDDRALIGQKIVDSGVYSGTSELPLTAVVCDGCGGYKGGGLAAETVLNILAGVPCEELLIKETYIQISRHF